MNPVAHEPGICVSRAIGPMATSRMPSRKLRVLTLAAARIVAACLGFVCLAIAIKSMPGVGRDILSRPCMPSSKTFVRIRFVRGHFHCSITQYSAMLANAPQTSARTSALGLWIEPFTEIRIGPRTHEEVLAGRGRGLIRVWLDVSWIWPMTVGVVALAPQCVALWRSIRRRNRLESDCTQCGACLMGLAIDRCPECGRIVGKAPSQAPNAA